MMRGIVAQLAGVVAILSVAALVFAQTSQSQTSPGTVPVPKPEVEKAAPGSTTLAPSEATAKKTEPIQSTKRFAEHSGLARTSAVVGGGHEEVSARETHGRTRTHGLKVA
jgi:hypothetical protein